MFADVGNGGTFEKTLKIMHEYFHTNVSLVV